MKLLLWVFLFDSLFGYADAADDSDSNFQLF